MSRARLLRGAACWWFVGPGGIARLAPAHLDAAGRPRPAALRSLRRAGLLDQPAPRGYALTVLAGTACNAGCGYCFQNVDQGAHGAFRPRRIPPARLDEPTVERVLAFADRRRAVAGLDRLDLTIFGGEPLLEPAACGLLLERAADHGLVAARLVTNGTLLTPRLAERLHGLGLRTVQVTFDGDRRQHDGVRATRAGRPTFDLILGNVAGAAARVPLRWLLRVNVSRTNQGGISTLIDRLAAALPPAACTLKFALLAATGAGHGEAPRADPALAARIARWQRQALDAGFGLPLPRARLPCRTCGFEGGRYGAVVAPDGTLASCWETAGDPGRSVGDVVDGYRPGVPWTRCTYPAAPAFQDAVDAALLDRLYGRDPPAAGMPEPGATGPRA